ncbi:hypothetical protein RFI_03309 [Reticulomyxa filosa]|uniref:SPX domain-containing protein n=1 Tax=Reticulomyxa filosa TaxID=46433 RepID=X6P6Q7_RETFI|nr:hypothetical protein RFI_03309 [Reticulomyxa filosa]|eukprot:ETO33793.1 hypothetical protein RFI_03309 [Reticulomyxa filosa]
MTWTHKEKEGKKRCKFFFFQCAHIIFIFLKKPNKRGKIYEAKKSAERRHKLHLHPATVHKTVHSVIDDKYVDQSVQGQMPLALISGTDIGPNIYREMVGVDPDEGTKVSVTQVAALQLEEKMPEIAIPTVKAIELQFVQHLTAEFCHVSSFYAEQCQIFAKQVLSLIITIFFFNHTDKLLQAVRDILTIEKAEYESAAAAVAKKTTEKRKQSDKKKHDQNTDATTPPREWPHDSSVNALMRIRATFNKNQRIVVNVAAQKAKLRKFFRQTYHALAELSKYRILNATAFVEIAKKHDEQSLLWKDLKNLVVDAIKGSNLGSVYFEEYLVNRLEDVYSSLLTSSNDGVRAALQKLRAPPTKEQLDFRSCFIGICCGVCITLFIACALLWGKNKVIHWQTFILRREWLTQFAFFFREGGTYIFILFLPFFF